MTHDTRKSEALFEFASQYLVAGVSGSARMNAALGHPVYLTHGDGCRLYDVDGQSYLDYNLSHGASFLGHNHPGVRQSHPAGAGHGRDLRLRDGASQPQWPRPSAASSPAWSRSALRTPGPRRRSRRSGWPGP